MNASAYATTFKKMQPQHDPRHVEAYVRLQFSTLDHLDHATLSAEAELAAQCIDLAGKEEAESLALSFGLVIASS